MSEKFPVTPAIRVLRQHKAMFSEHLYAYEDKGGTAVSSRELGVDEHCVIKTLVMEDERHQPLVVLMHGDCEVSTKNLARFLNVKTITPCTPQVADKHSGYQGRRHFAIRHQAGDAGLYGAQHSGAGKNLHQWGQTRLPGRDLPAGRGCDPGADAGRGRDPQGRLIARPLRGGPVIRTVSRSACRTRRAGSGGPLRLWSFP